MFLAKMFHSIRPKHRNGWEVISNWTSLNSSLDFKPIYAQMPLANGLKQPCIFARSLPLPPRPERISPWSPSARPLPPTRLTVVGTTPVHATRRLCPRLRRSSPVPKAVSSVTSSPLMPTCRPCHSRRRCASRSLSRSHCPYLLIIRCCRTPFP